MVSRRVLTLTLNLLLGKQAHMDYFRVKNLEKHQHYKERCPPWIKLHRSILQDYEFCELSDTSKLQLVLIFLLASQVDNKLPINEGWIKKQIGVNTPVNLKPLFESGFIELIPDASKGVEDTLASCKHGTEVDADSEAYTPTETYKTTETYTEWFEEDWLAYPRKAGSKPKAKSSYLKSITSPEKREEFQEKTKAYLASVNDAKYYQQGATWFKGWEDHVIDQGNDSSVENNISTLKELEAQRQ